MLITTPCVVHEQGWANSFARLSVCQSVCFKSNFKQVRQGIYKLYTQHKQWSRQFFCQLLPANRTRNRHSLLLRLLPVTSLLAPPLSNLHYGALAHDPEKVQQTVCGVSIFHEHTLASYCEWSLEAAGKRTASMIVCVQYQVCKYLD